MFTGIDMKFRIGRNQENDLVLKEDTVSGEHAEVQISKDFNHFTLTDLESTNGTKVNGRNILSKEITAKDTFQFGNQDLSGTKFFESIENYIKGHRTDFSKEFLELLNMEADYKAKRRSLNKNYRVMAMLPRLLITIGVVVTIYFFPNIGSDLRYPLMIGATLVGSTISTLGISEQKKEELLDKLKTRFQLQFVCPKCGSEFYGKEGLFWKEKKTCRNNNCNATWDVK